MTNAELTYTNSTTGSNYTDYFNISRDVSAFLSKNHEVTTRDGHVKGYLVTVEIQGMNPGNIFSVQTIPNTWKMRNSFRKFHAYRDLMFANAGIDSDEVGRYGHTIRPFMDATLATANVPFFGTIDGGDSATGGDWDYSRLATVPLYTDDGPPMGASTLAVADEWPVHVLEENVFRDLEGGTSGTYTSVGMIHSYNLDRMEVQVATPDTTITGPSNPLAALIASGNQAAGEILEIATEQELELPPYDLADGGDSVVAAISGIRRAPSILSNLKWTGFVPCGLFSINFNQGASVQADGSANGNPQYLMNMHVLGEVLCKDMA